MTNCSKEGPLEFIEILKDFLALPCNALQCPTMPCMLEIALQCLAMPCNTLQTDSLKDFTSVLLKIYSKLQF